MMTPVALRRLGLAVAALAATAVCSAILTALALAPVCVPSVHA